jgi:outer membrane lipoprotein LolB
MALALLLLSACATQTPMDDRERLASFHANLEKLVELESWQVQGRLALATASEAWSATLHWTQTQQSYQMKVIAPLGRGSFDMQGDGDKVTLRLSREQVLQARDPETLLRDNFGWTVPVSGLRYWILGLPEPEVKISRLTVDESGRISTMEQSGWQLSYSRYSSQGGYELPGQIALVNGDMKLRLAIRRWTL